MIRSILAAALLLALGACDVVPLVPIL